MVQGFHAIFLQEFSKCYTHDLNEFIEDDLMIIENIHVFDSIVMNFQFAYLKTGVGSSVLACKASLPSN